VATLLPAPQESVDFDTTQNVIIEGDNLEVLKLLQKSYLGKVKMIYIDPPYNTGNDFIYPDNYAESLQTYLEYTGQVDDEGKRFSTNTETDGRFHSKWMSMMYPRLMLARNLLTEDGVIFISISDIEVSNLDLICREVFGPQNSLGRFVWTFQLSENQGIISRAHEHILVFARNANQFERFRLTERDLKELGPEISDACFRAQQAKNPMSELLIPSGTRIDRNDRFVVEQGEVDFGVATCEFLDRATFHGGVLANDVRLRAAWTMKAQCEKYFTAIKSGLTPEVRDSKGQRVLEIYFSSTARLSYRKERSQQSKVSSHITDLAMTYVRGREAVEQLFSGKNPFQYPKPPELLRRLVELTTDSGDIVMDFFAGSGTLGHSVWLASAVDGMDRKFLLVQLPERVLTDSEKSATAVALLSQLKRPMFISELTKERVRRAAKEIAKEAGGASKLKLADGSGPQDLGFRVFKLDTSNFRVWDAAAPAGDEAKLAEQLRLQVEHVESGRGGLDVVFEVLLKSKLPLTSKVEKTKVSGGEVWSVESGRLLVVVDEGVDLAGVRELSKRDPKPETVVFLDRCFGGKDALKANASKIFQDADIEFRTI
jgi:adenine-specific DNA-methyltransferase